MQLISKVNLSSLRIKKKAWMLEDNWHVSICFTDRMSDTVPKYVHTPRRCDALPNTNFGMDNHSNEHNGPNN